MLPAGTLPNTNTKRKAGKIYKEDRKWCRIPSSPVLFSINLIERCSVVYNAQGFFKKGLWKTELKDKFILV